MGPHGEREKISDPSLTCSFPQIYHDLNFPRPAPIWPCSPVGRATVICSGGRGFESRRDQRLFSFSVWVHFLSGMFIRTLTIFKPLYMLNSAQRPNRTGYPFTYSFRLIFEPLTLYLFMIDTRCIVLLRLSYISNIIII